MTTMHPDFAVHVPNMPNSLVDTLFLLKTQQITYHLQTMSSQINDIHNLIMSPGISYEHEKDIPRPPVCRSQMPIKGFP